MNSIERVQTTLNHQNPDRCPINFRATGAIIDAICNHYRKDYNSLLEHLNVDFREVNANYIGPPLKTSADGSVFDVWGVSRRELIRKNSRDVFVNHSPLCSINTVAGIRDYSWPKVGWFDFSKIEQDCNANEGYAISTPGIHVEGYHGVFHLLTYLFGMEKALMQLVSDEKIMQEAINQIMGFMVNYYEKFLQKGRGKIHFLFYKDDFGAQNNLLISRNMFLKYFAPGIKNMVELAESYDAKLILHSCGSVYKLIPDFIQLGVKVLDPIQTSASGMDIEVLKEEFGDKLTFHGAIDTQVELPKKSALEIKELVYRTIKILGRDGGYFFSPSHRIQQDTPIENVVAMYEAVNEFYYE